MPAALLDTNAVSDLMRDHLQFKSNVASWHDSILTSVVVVGEIRYGLSRLPPGTKRNELEIRAQNILSAIPAEPIAERTAESYGLLKALLESRGQNLDDNDLWIAATTLTAGSVLVSRDQVFRQIPGLQVVDWSV
jgi:predicted nucleic acid-binding protein